MPFITDTPRREMNPMAAEMLKGSPATSSARMPPATANGMPASASKVSLVRLKRL